MVPPWVGRGGRQFGCGVPTATCSPTHRSALPRLAAVDFYSAYAHGFVRVAACTLGVSIVDPMANARAVLEEARGCDGEGVAVAIFPELCLTGYSVEDLFLQDTLLDAV